MPSDHRRLVKIAAANVLVVALLASTAVVTTGLHARIGCCGATVGAAALLAEAPPVTRDAVVKVIRFDRGASLLHITPPERRLRPGQTITLALPRAMRLDFEVVAVTDSAATGRVLLDETDSVPEVGTPVTVSDGGAR